jgi:uncharacterized membrane protein
LKARLLGLWESVRTSFWFVPMLMALGAVALSTGTVAVDSGPVGKKLADSVGWLWSGGADGARSLLSTVASSMITVAGTVFSITIAALTLASSQFGPRLLRNFTRDAGNQVVLGTFVATYLYCLLVLRTVRGTGEGDFVPYLSVTCGTLLAAAGIGVLIYFIHHVASSIQAESLVASIGGELKQDIVRLRPPAPAGPGDADPELPFVPPQHEAVPVHATASGYVQAMDRDGLVAAAKKADLFLQVLRRPGDFVSCGCVLLRVWAQQDALNEEDAARLRRAFSLGARRTPVQDVRYGVRQLTEIAARALSPGINDPFTAMGCADWLADALAEMARHHGPSGLRRDLEGKPRLLEQPVGFAELAHLGFEPLRTYGADTAVMAAHILGVLARLAEQVDRPEHRAALLHEAELTAAAASQSLRTDADLERVHRELERMRAELAR